MHDDFWRRKPAQQKPLHARLLSSPTRVISLSFAGLILAGTLLLMLPAASREGVPSPFLDCLFTSTSATCVTGLVVYDTFSHWSMFGHTVILALIQIGGLGLVTLTTFFNLVIGRKLGLRGMHLAQESVSSMDADIRQLIATVIRTSIVVEGTGAVLLALVFVPQYGSEGLFISLFTSISAFCNAGFDLFGRQEPYISLCGYADNALVAGVIGALIIAGGIGFIVVYDLAHWRAERRLTLHTRIVLVTTIILIFLGMAVTAVCEWNNPLTFGGFTPFQKLGASWFHSVSCRTAGFNIFSMEDMHNSTKLFSSALMFIGAAPGSTGGGIKCTTIAVIAMTVCSVVRGREEPVLFGRKIEKGAVYKSMAVTALGICAVLVTAGCIAGTVHASSAVSGTDALFESISAFATVGLSVGVTGVAGPFARLLLIFSMYLGRLGPVTFFLSLAMRSKQNRREILPEGKIQIG